MVWVNLDRHLTRTQQHNNSEDPLSYMKQWGACERQSHLSSGWPLCSTSCLCIPHQHEPETARPNHSPVSLSLHLSLTQGSPHNTNTGRPFTQILSFQLSAPTKPPGLQMGDDRQSRGLWDLIRCIKEGVGGPKDSKSLCVTQRWSERPLWTGTNSVIANQIKWNGAVQIQFHVRSTEPPQQWILS